MQIGIIADIHGNLPALEAVLKDMPPVEKVVCLGDIVGYNPWPAAAVEQVRSHADHSLKGNHDRYVYRPESTGMNTAAAAALRYTAEHLSDEKKNWLLSLNDKATVLGTGLYAVHSHPERLDRYVMPGQFEEMTSYLDGYDGLLLAHTHIQHSEDVDGNPVVNPGSVGQPRDGDPRAAYAVMDTEGSDVELRRVSYDVAAVQAAIREAGLPGELADRLADGR